MEDKQLTLVQHLSELRKRIIIIIFLIIVGSIATYGQIDIIIDYIVKPANNLEFIYLSPPELFVAYIKVSILSGMVLTSPITFMQVWLFMKPGLKKSERKYLLFALYFGILFFIIGAIFAYYTIVPMTIKFFTDVSTDGIAPLFSFGSYLSFISSLIFSFGIVFELPLLIILLTQLNLINTSILKKYRKLVILLIFIIAAILTPPDVISQLLLALPMLFLYEFSIWISSALEKRKRKKVIK